jgi:hypothetical protein
MYNKTAARIGISKKTQQQINREMHKELLVNH